MTDTKRPLNSEEKEILNRHFLFLQKKAKDGYFKEISPRIVKFLIEDIKNSQFCTVEVQKFLLEAFGNIQKGMDANKAFLLKGSVSGSGRKSSELEKRDEQMAYEVFIRSNFPEYHDLEKVSVQEAKKVVAKLYDVKEATVKKAYERYKKNFLK